MVKILLMEDDPDQSALLALILEGAGHEVTTSERGTEALALIEKQPFDLLIADMFVKRGANVLSDGGITLINRIRLDERLPNPKREKPLPIIVISGGFTFSEGGLNILTQAKDTGADLCLPKPVDKTTLIEAVDSLMRRLIVKTDQAASLRPPSAP